MRRATPRHASRRTLGSRRRPDLLEVSKPRVRREATGKWVVEQELVTTAGKTTVRSRGHESAEAARVLAGWWASTTPTVPSGAVVWS